MADELPTNCEAADRCVVAVIEALIWTAQNLDLVRRARFGKENRELGEDGLALLLYLCETTNQKTGTFFPTAETMRDASMIADVRVVRRLLAGLEELGWIERTGDVVSYRGRGRPTPEYKLTLPGLDVPAEKSAKGVHQDTNTT